MKSIITLLISLSLFSVALTQENLKINKIRFEGNEAFSNSNLKEQITLVPTSFIKEKIFKKDPVYFTKEYLEDDLLRIKIFYQKEGYLQIQLPEPDIIITKKNKLDITFHIKEGSPIEVDKVEYVVDSGYSIEETLPKIELKNIRIQSKLRKEKIFRDEWCLADQELINTQFNNIGYTYAEAKYIIKVDTISNKAKVIWTIDRHRLVRFGPTTVEGNERVPENAILKQLTYDEGDVWSKEAIDLSQKRLYNLGMFRVSSLKTVAQEKHRDTLATSITIKEAPVWTTRFGVGFGKEDRLRVFSEIQRLGTFTNVGRINFYAKHSALEPYNIDFKFTQPALIFPINSMVINPYVQKQNEPGYVLTRNGFNLSFLQNFSDYFNTNITFFFEDVKQDTTDLSLIDLEDLEETIYTKSGISLGFLLSNADPRLDPINGHSLSLNYKTNGNLFTHQIPFIRTLLEYKKYWGVNYLLTIAFRGKIGFVEPTKGSEYIPPEERFYAGGSRSVRGWARSELGPKDDNGKPLGGRSLLEGSTELRINLNSNLILATFMDFGNVWRPSFTYNLNELKYAAGFGIRYKTPIGPVGIDFARPIFNETKAWQFHFNIGHPF